MAQLAHFQHLETAFLKNSLIITIIKATTVTWERLLVCPHIRKYANLTLVLIVWTQMMRKHLIWEVPLHKLVRMTVTGSVNWGKADKDRSWRQISQCYWVNKDGQWRNLEMTRYRGGAVIGLWPASLWLIRPDSYRWEAATSWSVFLRWKHHLACLEATVVLESTVLLTMMINCNYIPFSTTALKKPKQQHHRLIGLSRIGHDLKKML